MDCKSPMSLLADMSAKKHAEVSRMVGDPVAPVAPPNFDYSVDSPSLPLSRKRPSAGESPFLSISRNGLPNSSPLSQVLANASAMSPQVGSHSMAHSPPLTHGSDSGDSSPAVSASKNFADLADIKASPRIDVLMQAAECSEKQKKKRQPPNPEKKSQYRGVSWQKTSRAWVAQYKSNGKTTYLGLFATEEDAARAYDVAVYVHSLGTKTEPRLNFGRPDQEIVDAYVQNGNVPPGRLGATAPRRVEDKIEITENNGEAQKDKHVTSNYRGVSWYAARQIWKASIQVNRKKEYIGRFETEEEAARAYNKRAQELRGKDAILNQVPDTVTRYPPGEVPLPPEQLAKNFEESKARKKENANKRTSAATKEESKKVKISQPEKKTATAVPPPSAASAFQSATKGNGLNHFLAGTPDFLGFLNTPNFNRLADSDRKSLQPLPKPSFQNIDDEVQRALSSDNGESVFDVPDFASPLPNTARRKAAFTLGSTRTQNHPAFTPMFNGLFDSPQPFGSVTPGDIGSIRFDMSTGQGSRYRKTFVPNS